MTDPQRRQQEALELLKAGERAESVSWKTGYSIAHIRSLASAAGISLATINRGQETMRIIGLLRAGMGLPQIAALTSVTPERVGQIKKEALETGALLDTDFGTAGTSL
jgi:DNA-binding transcriptional regulator YhcF (GntR family)